jgi:glutamate dehydrogenase (NAD(P)+)
MAEKLFHDGFKIIAASDSRGGIYNEIGLPVDELSAWKNGGKTVGDFAGGKKITNAELLELPTDILVLAALENQITAANAAKIQAKLIVELANGPVDFAADKILAEKKIPVVPDILANSGGVIVSYFEWAQNRTGNILDEEYLRQLLEKKMATNWRRVYEKYQEKPGAATLRQAAYILAVRRVLTAEKLRGRI